MGNDGILLLDEAYRIKNANNVASNLIGLSLKELFGVDFRRFLTERDVELFEDMYRQVAMTTPSGSAPT